MTALRRVLLLLALLHFHSPSGISQFEVSHLAGGPGGPGYLDGIGSNARFSLPTGIWGNGDFLYVADSGDPGHSLPVMYFFLPAERNCRDGSSAVPATRLASVFRQYVGSVRTGFAMPNPASSAIQLSFDLISTAQSLDHTASASVSEKFFPHFVQSGGYTTEFVLFPTNGRPASVTLRFYSQSGQFFDLPVY